MLTNKWTFVPWSLDYLIGEKCGFFIKWLQGCLLEACYAKLVCSQKKQSQADSVEPVAYFYTSKLLTLQLVRTGLTLIAKLRVHIPVAAILHGHFERCHYYSSKYTGWLLSPFPTTLFLQFTFSLSVIPIIIYVGRCFNFWSIVEYWE